MNKFFTTLAFSLLLAVPAAAQVTIDDTKSEPSEESFRTEVRERDRVATEFENKARYRAERAAIRKERNYLEVSASVQGTLTAFNNSWIKTKGGDNAIAAIAQAHLLHNFKKDRFVIETVFDAKFGYNRMKITDANDKEKGVWFKNQDELLISTAPAFQFSPNWSFGSIIKFRTQFANGYTAREKQSRADRMSSFMAPGYLDVSLGFTYTCPKERFPIKINLSPLALSATFVESELVRKYFEAENSRAYGVATDRTSLYEGGSSIQIDFDRTFGKKGVIRYRTTLYSFYGWLSNFSSQVTTKVHPTVRWENTVNIKATKYLTTDLYFQMYYNKAQSTSVQTQTLLSVGLTYTFKNKEKK